MLSRKSTLVNSPEEKLHPSAYGCIIYILITVGRIPELFTFLGGLQLGKVGIIVGIVGLFFYKPDGTQPIIKVFQTPVGKLILFFALIAIISISYSIWVSNSIKLLKSLFLSNIILFFLIVKSSINTKTIKYYIYCLIVSAFLLSFFTILSSATGRASASATYDPNDLAKVLIIILPITLILGFTTRNFIKWVFYGIGAILIFGVLLTGSRGGLIAMAACFGYLFISSIPNNQGELKSYISIKVSLIAVLILSSGFILTLVPQSTVEHMSTLFDLEDDYNFNEDEGRIAIWTRSLKALERQPIGYGLHSFQALEGSQGGRYMTAHNTLIQVSAELGVLGGIVFILLYIVCWHKLNFLNANLYKLSPPKKWFLILLPFTAIIACASLLGFIVSFISALVFLFLAIIYLNFDQKWAQREQGINKNELIFYSALVISLKASFVGQFISSFFLSAGYHAIFYAMLGVTTGIFSYHFKKISIT